MTPSDDLHWHGADDDSPTMQFSFTVGGAIVWATSMVTGEEYGG